MKKTLSILLTVLLLLSAFSVQSFAVLGFDKIESVEVVSLERFSLKSIYDYIDCFEEGATLEGEDREYMLYSTLDVTISSGEVITVPENDNGYSVNGKRTVAGYAWVDVYEVIEAAENGSYTVPLYIETALFSSVDVMLDRKTVTQEISFPEKIVKSLTLVSGTVKFYEYMEETYHEGDDSLFYLGSDLDKLRFDIVYDDGSKVRADVEKRIEFFYYWC